MWNGKNHVSRMPKINAWRLLGLLIAPDQLDRPVHKTFEKPDELKADYSLASNHIVRPTVRLLDVAWPVTCVLRIMIVRGCLAVGPQPFASVSKLSTGGEFYLARSSFVQWLYESLISCVKQETSIVVAGPERELGMRTF
jgi:hypothetical protein